MPKDIPQPVPAEITNMPISRGRRHRWPVIAAGTLGSVALIAALGACTSSTEGSTTPYSTSAGPGDIPVSAITLDADPGNFLNERVQVTVFDGQLVFPKGMLTDQTAVIPGKITPVAITGPLGFLNDGFGNRLGVVIPNTLNGSDSASAIAGKIRQGLPFTVEGLVESTLGTPDFIEQLKEKGAPTGLVLEVEDPNS